MGKATNKKLAAQISGRIDEILERTGFTLVGLAEYAQIGKSAIRSYHSQTIPISVEIVDKMCEPLSITLPHFFDFEKALELDLSKNMSFKQFKDYYLPLAKGFFHEEKMLYMPKPTTQGKKRERDYIAYIIYQTDYFDTPKSIAQMAIDFKADHELDLESGRLYELLRKYVNNELHTDLIFPLNADGSVSKRSVQTYQKMKK